MAQNNIACRIFKEQIDLIQQLPENERAVVLYSAIMQAFNQFDNQNENQNECAYVSVSVSVLGKCILDLLSKNIAFKEFSSNYGGKREGAGKPRDTTTPSRTPSRSKDGDRDIDKDNINDNKGGMGGKEDVLYIGESKIITMTQNEWDKLLNYVGNKIHLTNLVGALENRIIQKGEKYKSHYSTLQNWFRRDINAIPNWSDDFYEEEKRRLNIPLTKREKQMLGGSNENK